MTKFTIGALVVLSAASVIQAQDLVRVNIPFGFAAGNQVLPAGDYTLRLNVTPNTVVLQSKDYTKNLIVMSHPAQARTAPEEARLTFHRYGDQYFLSTIFTPYSNIGQELPRSKGEREQLTASKPAAQVTILARR